MNTNPTEFRCLHTSNFQYLCAGLTLDEDDMKVLDATLSAFEEKTGIVKYISLKYKDGGYDSELSFKGPQYIFYLDKMKVDIKKLCTVTVGQNLKPNAINLPPLLLINLFSPGLQIHQRIEIPIRYLIKDSGDLKGTHMVYLHALEIDNKENFSYYGITKRGWMKRFIEHVKLAMKGNPRKFPQLFGTAIKNQFKYLQSGIEPASPRLTGSYHVVCAAGRTSKDAHKIESYLINKRSLHDEFGLNMIKGIKVSEQ